MIKLVILGCLVTLLTYEPAVFAQFVRPSTPRYRHLIALLSEASATNVPLLDSTITISLTEIVERPLLAEMVSVVDWVKGWAKTEKQLDTYELRATNLLKTFVLMVCVDEHMRKMNATGASSATKSNLEHLIAKRRYLTYRVHAIDTLYVLALRNRLLALPIAIKTMTHDPYFRLELGEPNFARFYWTEPLPVRPLWSAYDLPPITVSVFECFARPIPARPLYNYVNEIILLHRAQLFVLDVYNDISQYRINLARELKMVSNALTFTEFVRAEYALHSLNPLAAYMKTLLRPNLEILASELIENDLKLAEQYRKAQFSQDDISLEFERERLPAVFVLLDGGRRVEVAAHNRMSPDEFIKFELDGDVKRMIKTELK